MLVCVCACLCVCVCVCACVCVCNRSFQTRIKKVSRLDLHLHWRGSDGSKKDREVVKISRLVILVLICPRSICFAFPINGSFFSFLLSSSYLLICHLPAFTFSLHFFLIKKKSYRVA